MSHLVYALDALLFRVGLRLPRRVGSALLGGFSFGSYILLRIRLKRGELSDPCGEGKLGEMPDWFKPKLLRLSAELRLQAGRFEEAAALCEEAVANERLMLYRVEQRAFAGLAYYRKGDWRRAIETLLSARRELVRSVVARHLIAARLWHHINFLLFAAHERVDELEAAIGFLRAAMTWQVGYERARLCLLMGQALMQMGAGCRARKWLLRARRDRSLRKEVDLELSRLSIHER